VPGISLRCKVKFHLKLAVLACPEISSKSRVEFHPEPDVLARLENLPRCSADFHLRSAVLAWSEIPLRCRVKFHLHPHVPCLEWWSAAAPSRWNGEILRWSLACSATQLINGWRCLSVPAI
jgi:hypothetical protein